MLFHVRAWVGLAAVALAACGSTVTVPDPSGDSGASGAGANGSGANSSGANGSTGGGGAPSPTYCQDLCAQASTSPPCETDHGCVADCQAELADAGPCFPELDAAFKCILASPTCDDDDPACDAKLLAYRQCREQKTCGPQLCTIGGGSGGLTECQCERACKGQQASAECTVVNGIAQCICKVDGMAIAKCTDGPGRLEAACDLEVGCCAGLLPQDHHGA